MVRPGRGNDRSGREGHGRAHKKAGGALPVGVAARRKATGRCAWGGGGADAAEGRKRRRGAIGAVAAGDGKSGACGPGSRGGDAAGGAPGRGFSAGVGSTIQRRAVTVGGQSRSRVEAARAWPGSATAGEGGEAGQLVGARLSPSSPAGGGGRRRPEKGMDAAGGSPRPSAGGCGGQAQGTDDHTRAMWRPLDGGAFQRRWEEAPRPWRRRIGWPVARRRRTGLPAAQGVAGPGG
jgi:hypothetical protein